MIPAIPMLGKKMKIDNTATKAVVLTEAVAVDPTKAIMVNVETAVSVMFKDDAAAVDITLLAGVVYDFSITQVVTGVGVIGLY